ncbi:hypothetical protein ACFLZ1_05525, partial [Patescibacteria group bacterium]
KLKKIITGLNAMLEDFVEKRLKVFDFEVLQGKKLDLIIGTTPGAPVINKKMMQLLKKNGYVLDIGNGTISEEALDYARSKRIRILCLFMKPSYDGYIRALFKTKKILKNLGQKDLKGFSLISSGILGKKGDIIVDDIKKPKQIIGIADGKGDILTDTKKYQEGVKVVRKLIERGYKK